MAALQFLQHLRHEDGTGHGGVEGLGSAAEVGDGDGAGDTLADLRGEATALVAHTQGRSTRATGTCDIWLCSYGIYLNNCFRYRSGVVPVCCLKK